MTQDNKTMPVIIGLGKTGFSCARYFQRKNQPFAVIDTRPQPPGLQTFRTDFPEAFIHTGSCPLELLLQAREIILSPGLSPLMPEIQQAQQQGVEVMGDIELFAREARAPVIAITGTNAKGTVTTLLSEMIRAANLAVLTGGNIGTPALDLLAEKIPDFYVLEISSFQLETTHSLKPLAATILNISPDHLDRHGTLENYQKAKQRIYYHCENIVYHHDDLLTYPDLNYLKNLNKNKNIDADADIKTNYFSLTQPHGFHAAADSQGKYYLAHHDQLLLPTELLRIRGRHNWLNALAALALGHAIGLPLPAMLKALQEFRGLEYRCQWLATTADNISWYNDSKGTNVGATLAALEGLGETLPPLGRIILIAGGESKEADFSLLQAAVKKYVRCLILIGRDGILLRDALDCAVDRKNIYFAVSLKQAVEMAGQQAEPNDTVLLSPACASFDMFRDYEDRGKQFSLLVKDYLAHE